MRKVITGVSFTSSSYDEGVNLRENFLQPREDDVNYKGRDFIKREGTLPGTHHSNS
jgi:hypothetical protein